jgi:hypothetical protein
MILNKAAMNPSVITLTGNSNTTTKLTKRGSRFTQINYLVTATLAPSTLYRNLHEYIQVFHCCNPPLEIWATRQDFDTYHNSWYGPLARIMMNTKTSRSTKQQTSSHKMVRSSVRLCVILTSVDFSGGRAHLTLNEYVCPFSFPWIEKITAYIDGTSFFGGRAHLKSDEYAVVRLVAIVPKCLASKKMNLVEHIMIWVNVGGRQGRWSDHN